MIIALMMKFWYFASAFDHSAVDSSHLISPLSF